MPPPQLSFQFPLPLPNVHHRNPFRCRPSPILSLHPTSRPSTLIVGGGAAGFFTAITLARHAPSHSNVTILEASPTVLEKVRISGGGRCNVTSALHHEDPRHFATHYPRGAREMISVLARFGPADVVRFFEREGVQLKAEPSGKLFPISDSSESVVDALVAAANTAGVRVLTRKRVVRLSLDKRQQLSFIVSLADGETINASFVVIATGSARPAHKWASQLGHKIIPPVPSLFTFKVPDENLRALAGVAVDQVKLSLLLPARTDDVPTKKKSRRASAHLTQTGPLLVTHWGLSGPVVLTLSAFAARDLYHHRYRAHCLVDWLPHLGREEKLVLLKAARVSLAQKNVATVCPLSRTFPNRLWRYLIQREHSISPSQKWRSMSNTHIEKLVDLLSRCMFEIAGKGEFKEEFVTAGGVALSDIDVKTFESRKVPGLYFAGETLDVDGRTGGYNLEFAWSSGYIVGTSIAQEVLQAGGANVSASVT